jgi:hypothetical protein
MIGRRTFIKAASMAAVAATTSGVMMREGYAQQVLRYYGNGRVRT